MHQRRCELEHHFLENLASTQKTPNIRKCTLRRTANVLFWQFWAWRPRPKNCAVCIFWNSAICSVFVVGVRGPSMVKIWFRHSGPVLQIRLLAFPLLFQPFIQDRNNHSTNYAASHVWNEEGKFTWIFAFLRTLCFMMTTNVIADKHVRHSYPSADGTYRCKRRKRYRQSWSTNIDKQRSSSWTLCVGNVISRHHLFLIWVQPIIERCVSLLCTSQNRSLPHVLNTWQEVILCVDFFCGNCR